jgi:pyridoxamine 5'-phosphate oxidase
LRAGLADRGRSEEPNDPNAIALATVDADGLPNVRMVLLKEIETADAFVFYTNYGSRQGAGDHRLGQGGLSCCTGKALRRQIRVRGMSPAKTGRRRMPISPAAA